MTVPPVWAFILGALAAWRVWKLLSTDDVLDYGNLRERVAPEGSERRKFLDCPYCAGWWVSLLGTGGYYLVTDVPLRDGWFGFLVTVFAMNAVVVFIEVLLDLTVAVKDNEENG